MKKIFPLIVGVLIISLVLAGGVFAQEEPDLPSEMVCEMENFHPVITFLAENFEVGYDELLEYFCQGFGIGEIRQAIVTARFLDDGDLFYSDILDMRLIEGVKARGWGEIWQGFGLIGLGRSEEQNFEMQGDNDQDLEMDGDDDEFDNVCVDDLDHPVLMAIASQYDVDYDVLLGYFCAGFAVGEIKQALATAELDEVAWTFEELLIERSKDDEENSTGWGEIWQELGLIGKERNGELEGEGPELVEQNNKPDTPPGLTGNNGWGREGHPGRGKPKGDD